MVDLTGERGALVDAFALQSADVASAQKPGLLPRLHELSAAALSAELQNPVFHTGTASVTAPWAGMVDEATRQRLVDDLAKAKAAPRDAPQALVVARRDPRDALMCLRPAHRRLASQQFDAHGLRARRAGAGALRSPAGA